MATARQWLAGTRPKTLTAAVVPVLVGLALAVELTGDASGSWGLDLQGGIVELTPDVSGTWHGDIDVSRAVLALAVSLLLQLGVNFANDYSDGIRGSDQNRQGPQRLVGSGAAKPGVVLAVAWLCLAAVAVIGAVLSLWIGWEVMVVLGAAIAAAWCYTGWPLPYGYYALGEVSVLIFFGLVPTAGTVYLQTGQVSGRAVLAGAGVGLVAAALLMANNLRDVKTDLPARKFTLAVVVSRRAGETWARLLYALAWLGAAAVVPALALWGLAVGEGLNQLWLLLGWLAPLLAFKPIRVVLQAPFILQNSDSGDPPSDQQVSQVAGQLVGVLNTTGKLLLLYGVTLGAGLWLAVFAS